jgi:hypothetical protein
MVVLGAVGWPEVALLALNIVQVVVLALVGRSQNHSAIERERRRHDEGVDQADELEVD